MEYPESYLKLKYRDRLFVDCYLKDDLIEPTTSKNTYCDKLISYIFAYNKENEIKEALDFSYTILNWASKTFDKIDNYVNGCTVTVKVKNPKKYMSLVANSTKVFNRCNVAINDIRLAGFETSDKSKMLELKDAIFNSSIHSDDAKDRNENRKMAMKIFGLDQVKVDTSVDIYEASGRNILQSRLNSEDMNRADAPLVADSIEDIVNLKDDDEEGE